MRVPGAGDLRTTWTPARGEPRGWVWLQHGFARSGRHLGGLADLLAGHGFAVVRPDVASFTPWRSMHDRAYLTACALTIAAAVQEGTVADRGVAVGGPWLGVGHSAGAAIVVQAAAVLGAHGLPPAGLILLDPVDTVGGLLVGALPDLGAVPIVAFACPPSRCNRHGSTVDHLRGRAEIVDLAGLSHADPERIPARLDVAAVPPAGRAVVWACGPPGSQAAVVGLGERTLAAAERLCPV